VDWVIIAIGMFFVLSRLDYHRRSLDQTIRMDVVRYHYRRWHFWSGMGVMYFAFTLSYWMWSIVRL